MNRHLQKILNLIEQNKNLTAEETQSALQAVKDADKELEITAFKLERTEKVKRTTAILLEETIEELEQKRKAVEAQNRELEIETALEKVRSSALAMKMPGDMVEVCRIISDQLILLGVNNIRNIQTAIINELKGTYLNYQYFTAYNKGIVEETEYNKHPKVLEMVNEMKKSADAFFNGSFEDDELNVFRKYRKQDNQFPDPLLDNADAMHYYFYSIGPGGLGLTTYKALPKAGLKIFKRFHKVFTLAYRRFIDLETAIAQAREASIEAALEKVRAAAMSMNKPDDLLNICEVLYREFHSFGFSELRNAMVNIHNDEKGTFVNYDYSDEIGKSINHLHYNIHPVIENQIKQIRKANNAFSETVFSGKDLADWKAFRKKIGEKDDPRINDTTSLHYYFYSIGTGSIGISTFSSIDEEKIELLKRFRNVFSLSYHRYIDIALAEAQTREAQIELALERVRGSAMTMHNSNDISATTSAIFAELRKLGIQSIRSGVALLSKSSRTGEVYAAATSLDGEYYTLRRSVEMTQHTSLMKQYESWLLQENYVAVLSDEELKSYYQLPFFHSSASYVPPDHFDHKEYGYYIPFSEGLFYAWTIKPYSENEINILNRFKSIIDLTFRRFFDLQKAEAQAREAQIELALERVRARTMAMQKSDDLAETAYVLYQQFGLLGENPEQLTIGIVNESERVIELWLTLGGNQMNKMFKASIDEPIVINKIYAAWKEQKKSLIIDISGNDLKAYNNFRQSLTEYKEYNDFKNSLNVEESRRVIHSAFFSKGLLSVATPEQRPAETIKLLERFTGVFDLTYTRFLDLKKAEAQAREAQIEVALERVRAKGMAMHHTSELQEVVNTVAQQLQLLEMDINGGVFIAINDDVDEDIYLWGSSGVTSYVQRVNVPFLDLPIYIEMKEAIKKREGFFIEEYTREEKIEFFNYLFKHQPFNSAPTERKKHLLSLEGGYSRSLAVSYHTSILMINHNGKRFSDSDNEILKRFGKVFEQTYTRFLDLQKAEAQAREAKIEASLERVRSKAMSMHSSEDLSITVNVFFKELKTLGIIPIRCGVGRIDEATRTTSLTTTTSSQQGDSFEVIGKIKQTGHPVLDGIFENWKLQEEYHPILEGAEIKAYYSVMNTQIAYPDYPEDITQYGNTFPFKEGFVFAWTDKELGEEDLKIFRRFTSVLSLTYRRYLDLKETEARAFEAVRQSSLDRVRAEIASMRTAEDLKRITPIIWHELKVLEVPFIRCGVYIINETENKIQVYLTTPDGKSLGVLNLPFSANKLTSNTVEFWRMKKVYKEYWNRDKFINWTKSMIELGQVQNAETYQGSANPPESLNLHFVPFAQGMLYVGNTSPLTDEKLQLVKSLAEAFSIAYARYEDFKNLEDAKNRIEATLSELKSAQAQLIHSEKMASLGELTAGIAHEIKNPLNFVNNFSEVSRELLDEMKIELKNNNAEEVIQIAEDLKQNLEKINYHGKRADSIVKGMLLHSRGTSGEKVLTNINDLLDQYVVLAYHGMRAQNKEFNITIEKDYDETMEKLNVVPQDISRVFLNIINNACYAANDRKRNEGNNFSPLLKVSTRDLKNKVEIKIRDNGNGVPDSIREQIFNPFFTTKPTGEGTGLGLSLSYDIVTKVHHGEIKVESKEREFTEFIITLPKLQ